MWRTASSVCRGMDSETRERIRAEVAARQLARYLRYRSIDRQLAGEAPVPAVAARRGAGTSEKKDVDKLIRSIKTQSKGEFKTLPSKGGHKKVVDKMGKAVVDEHGPLIISSSPGDSRWREKHVKRLIDAGVLQYDPWDPPEKPRGSGRGFADPATKERSQQRLAAEGRRRAERTRRIRAKLEPLVMRLGGWDKHGLQAELARTIHHYLKTRGRVETWESEQSAVVVLSNLRKGGTLSDQSCICFELFFEDLEHAGDDEAQRQRYFKLLREAKGLAPVQEETGVVVRMASRLIPIEQRKTAGQVLTYEDMNVPTVALEAVMMMAAGGAANGPFDPARIMHVGQEILRLELLHRERQEVAS